MTAFMLACENGIFDVAKLLLEYGGVDVNAADKVGV